MLTIDTPRGFGAPGAGSKMLIVLAALTALALVTLAALPYFSMLASEDVARRTLQDFQFAYWPKRPWLLTHIVGGLVALLCGPVQLWLGLHNVKMELHRKLGLAYIAGMAIGSIGAFGLALKTDGGPVFGAGLFFLGVAWVTTTTLAYVAIRKGLVDQHKEWTIRSYVVTFGFVTFRATQLALQGVGLGLQPAIEIAAWSCWALPLLATEALIQGRKVLQVRS